MGSCLDRRLYVVHIDGDEGKWTTGMRGKQRTLKWAHDEAYLVHGTTTVYRPKPRPIEPVSAYDGRTP